jgi:hypothetical protein
MKNFNISAKMVKILPVVFTVLFLAYLSGCSNSTTNPNYQTDEQYLQGVVNNGYSSSQTDDDNIMANEKNDLNDGGAVSDGSGGPMNPIDSLIRWGRIIDNVNINLQGTFSGDTMYTVVVTRNITGHYRIIAIKNSLPDSVDKPYTETLKRNIVFKRVARNVNPIFNWRLYQISLLGGTTNTPPPVGTSNTQIISITVTTPNQTYTWAPSGPSYDFTTINFITRRFEGPGIPEVKRGDQVTVTVIVSSTETNNYVAWHWARNTFGFHRIPFTYVSSIPGGNGYFVTFQRSVTVYSNHIMGSFNGYINASTHESLYDDDPNFFSSTEVGIPYRVTQ